MPTEPTQAAPQASARSVRISGPDDVKRVFAEVNSAALGRDNTAAAARLVQSADEATLTAGISRVLPTPAELAELFLWPGGIRRGATVAVVGSTSLLLTLLAGAMAEGSWAGIVGMSAFGALAAAEVGVPIERLGLVPAPGPDWTSVVGALIDGVDVVAIATPPGAPGVVTRALMNRARQRGCVLLSTTAWPNCDLTIELVERRRIGLGAGHGRLVGQEVALRSAGRGRAAQLRTVETVLPPASIRPIALTAREALEAALGTLPDEPAEPVAVEPAADAWGQVAANAPPSDPWHDLLHDVPRG